MNAGRYSTTFAKLLAEMKNNQVLTHTSRRAFILELFDHLMKSSEVAKSLIAAGIFSKLELCLPVKVAPLTSNWADKIWSLFRKLRFNEDMLKKWNILIQRANAPSRPQKYDSAGSADHHGSWIQTHDSRERKYKSSYC